MSNIRIFNNTRLRSVFCQMFCFSLAKQVEGKNEDLSVIHSYIKNINGHISCFYLNDIKCVFVQQQAQRI